MKISRIQKNDRWQWRVSYQDAGQQRRAFFKTKADAEGFADGLQGNADPTFRRWANLTENRRFEALSAAERAAKGGYSLIEATEYFERNSGRASVSIDTAWTQYLELKKSQQGASVDALKNTGIAWRFLENFKSAMVADLTAEQITGWILGHDWAPASRNSFLTQLNVFLNWSRKRGFLQHLPTESIPRAILDEKPVGILNTKAADALMRACEKHDPGLLTYAALSLFCGLRPSECQRIRWDHINLRARTIDVAAIVARKTRKGRIVHLSRQAVAWLKKKGDLPPTNFRRRWDKVRERAELVRIVPVPGEKRYLVQPINWPDDCLRHSFASHFTALNGIAAAALECGNSEQVQIKHYRLPIPKAEARRYFSILPAE